jgi:hypothetical protein
MTAIELWPALPPGSWREARVYADLIGCGPRGLAWELLRRDRGYAEAAHGAQASLGDDPARLPAASAAFAARWGLHFRRGSGEACARRAPVLDLCL